MLESTPKLPTEESHWMGVWDAGDSRICCNMSFIHLGVITFLSDPDGPARTFILGSQASCLQ